MSFSYEQKRTIITSVYKSVCCRRALLSGVLFAKGELSDDGISLRLEKREYADFVSALIRETYGKSPDISRPAGGGRVVIVSFSAKSARNYIANLTNSELNPVLKCVGCQSAFLRGVFLGAGRTCDPEKEYFVEYSLGERTDAFARYLERLGIRGRITRKKTGVALYFKDSSVIEDLFGYTGLNSAVFALIDARFGGEERKKLMRVINCETNNIQRTVNAASQQTELISELERSNLLSSLPEELEATARLRLKYPDYSLSQLSQVAVPAISKPGLSHRLKKITELAKQLLHKED
ncbi:MAG: DNA-binding protein WhiA [Clostridia bacterium]|nr:DNA-binding protein WhiA [Clostridia bacterium]